MQDVKYMSKKYSNAVIDYEQMAQKLKSRILKYDALKFANE